MAGVAAQLASDQQVADEGGVVLWHAAGGEKLFAKS